MNIMDKIKITTLLIILISSIQGIYAQSTGGVFPFNTKDKVVIDTVQLMVSYELVFLPDSTKKNVKLTNQLSLALGNSYAKQMNSEYFDIENLQKKARKGSEYNLEGRGLAATIIYKNKKTNQMEVNVKLADQCSYRYIESIPMQDWKILNQKKEVLGYSCQAATTTYLGRTYTAWFAPTIPIHEGPWKFSGLPGLILEVADNRGHYVFKSIGIRRPKQQEFIEKYKIKFVDINRKKLNSYIKNLHENYATVLEAQGYTVAYFTPEGKEIDNKKLSYPYNPIELE